MSLMRKKRNLSHLRASLQIQLSCIKCISYGLLKFVAAEDLDQKLAELQLGFNKWDFSNYPKDHVLYDPQWKNMLGRWGSSCVLQYVIKHNWTKQFLFTSDYIYYMSGLALQACVHNCHFQTASTLKRTRQVVVPLPTYIVLF